MKNILNIIKDSNYSFSLFDQSLIDKLEQKITIISKSLLEIAKHGVEMAIEKNEQEAKSG